MSSAYTRIIVGGVAGILVAIAILFAITLTVDLGSAEALVGEALGGALACAGIWLALGRDS